MLQAYTIPETEPAVGKLANDNHRECLGNQWREKKTKAIKFEQGWIYTLQRQGLKLHEIQQLCMGEGGAPQWEGLTLRSGDKNVAMLALRVAAQSLYNLRWMEADDWVV